MIGSPLVATKRNGIRKICHLNMTWLKRRGSGRWTSSWLVPSVTVRIDRETTSIFLNARLGFSNSRVLEREKLQEFKPEEIQVDRSNRSSHIVYHFRSNFWPPLTSFNWNPLIWKVFPSIHRKGCARGYWDHGIAVSHTRLQHLAECQRQLLLKSHGTSYLDMSLLMGLNGI